MPEHDLVLTKANAPEVSDQAMEGLTKDLGVVGMPPDMISKLVKLGVGIQERGLIKLANGVALVTTEMLVDTARRIHKKLTYTKITVEETRSLSYALGYVTRQATQNLNTVIRQEVSEVEISEEKDKRRRKSFVPHAIVQSSGPVQVNIHNHPEESKKLN